jgi:hypothetical protein
VQLHGVTIQDLQGLFGICITADLNLVYASSAAQDGATNRKQTEELHGGRPE